MRKLALAITAAVALLAVSFVSPVVALAASSSQSPVTPGPHLRARLPWIHSVSGRTAAPYVKTATALTCDAGFDTVASPNGVNNNELVDVSAVSANDIWAVGDTSNSGVAYDQTLAEHWDGSSWTIIPTSNPGPYHNDLTAVDAISTNDVWVVGIYTTAVDLSTFAAYAQHWNGSSWSGYVFSPTNQTLVFGVTATSSTDVWIAGTYIGGGGFPLTLIEHWNGTAWSQIASPSPTGFDNELFAVSGFSSTDVWAVGETTASIVAAAQSFAMHWDGSFWTQVATGNSVIGDNEIDWVQALEGGHAVGVGFGNFTQIFNPPPQPPTTLTPKQSESWDLNATSPNTLTNLGTGLGSGSNQLIGVAKSGSAVWAVGFSRATLTGPRVTLAIPATWNSGTHTLTWGTPGASASPGAGNDVLDAVTAVSPYGFWATGWQDSGTGFSQTLTESYCARHFGVTGAPTSSPAGSSFSLTVTEQNGDGSIVTGYRGTVHFTSSDNAATLPADYMFTALDSGVHTFTGVVLNTPGNQSITVSDIAMPFTMPTPTPAVRVLCVGTCPSTGGTAGDRTTTGGPATILGSRDGATQSGSGTAGPRLPRPNPVATSRDTASNVVSTRSGPLTNVGTVAPDAAPTISATVAPTASASISLARARPNEAIALVARTERVSQPRDQSLWYLLPLVPLLICLLALSEVRRRRFKETSNARI